MDATPRDLDTLTMALGFLGFVLFVVAVASTGAMFKPGAWYQALDKPAWTPPNWLFPIAWTLLYFAIAVAGWLAWRNAGFDAAGPAYAIYFLQLCLNAAWSWLFFGLHRMDLALLDMAALWIAIVANIVLFYAIQPLAGYLLIPYLIWVTYAAALNFKIWQMN